MHDNEASASKTEGRMIVLKWARVNTVSGKATAVLFRQDGHFALMKLAGLLGANYRTCSKKEKKTQRERKAETTLRNRRRSVAMLRRFAPLAVVCFAAFAPGGARSFQLGGLCLRAQSRSRSQHAQAPALRASANADADAGMSKEQKLHKYQMLAVEMTTKARKLPPG